MGVYLDIRQFTLICLTATGDKTRRLPLLAWCASQQYDLSEEPGCVTGIRFVFSIAYGKGHGVVGFQFSLP